MTYSIGMQDLQDVSVKVPTDRLAEFTAKLERELAAQPWNFTLATVLAETYADRQQIAEATHVE